eukprot:g1537.t1
MAELPPEYEPSLDAGLAKHMTRTDQVFEQVKHGLYMVKKYAQLLKNIAEGHKAAAQNQAKAITHIESRRAKLQQDGMDAYVAVFLEFNNYLSQSMAEEIKFANAVTSHIVNPLLELYKRGEKRRKQLSLEDARIQNAWALIQSGLRKEREECMKAWQELKKAAADSKKNPTETGKRKSDAAALSKLRLKTQRLFQQYSDYIAANNSRIHKLQQVDVPKLLMELEKMEQTRLGTFVELSHKYTELKAKQTTKLEKLTHDLQRAFVSLQFAPTLEHFISKCAAESDKDKDKDKASGGGIHELSYDLPVPPSLLGEGSGHLDSALLKDDRGAHANDHDTLTAKASRRISNFFPGTRNVGSALSLTSTASSSASSLETKGEENQLSEDENDPPDELPVITEHEIRTVLVCRACYDLNSADPADLSFVKGQFMRVVSKNEEDPHDTSISLIENTEDNDLWWHAFLLAGYGSSFWREHITGLVPSNYIQQVHLTNTIELRPFLEYPTCLKAFSDFLESEYSAENIHFWVAVQEFHRLAIELESKAPEPLPPKTPRKPDGTAVRPLKGPHRSSKGGGGRGKDLPVHPTQTTQQASILLERCKQIVQQFIASDGEQQVNVGGASREHITEGLRTGQVSADVFDAAQQEVLAMMRRDSWGRFKKTDAFKSIIASYKEVSPALFGRPVVD